MPFETGLCGCEEDRESCLDVIFCFPCQTGRQFRAVEGNLNEISYVHCVLATFLPHCCVNLIRFRVSDKLQLDEGRCSSIVSAWLCTLCSLCQTHRQLALRRCPPGGFCLTQPSTDRIA
jgi:Cys-rich protein (TIGR01571 family)